MNRFALLLLLALAGAMLAPLFVAIDDRAEPGRPMPPWWDPVARAGSAVVPDRLPVTVDAAEVVDAE